MNFNFEDTERTTLDPFFCPTLQLILKGANFPLPSYLKLYHNSPLAGTNWTLFAATDVNDTENHPLYKSEIKFQYNFPLDQQISLEIWRVSMGFNNLFASAKFNLVKLLRSPTKYIELQLVLSEHEKDQPAPLCKISIDEPLENKDILSMTFGAKLHKRFIFPPRLYFSLWKSIDFSPFTKVLQSIQVSGNNPSWPQIQVKVSNLFKQSGVLRIVIHEKSDKIMGHSEFAYADIIELHKKAFDLIKFESRKNGETEIVDQGVVELIDCRLDKAMTFTEYLTAGLELQYYTIIDFSPFCKNEHQNGESEDFSSLHKFKETIKLVTNVIGNYLGEGEILGLGVGAKKANDHGKGFFSLREEKKAAFHDSKGLLDAFDEAVKNLEEKTDLVLLPAVRETLKKIKTDIVLSQKMKYHVCALFISSEIKDIQDLIDQIVLASYGIPVSFVIFEIAKEASSQLRVFHSDVEQLRDSQNRPIERVNVKLVCLSEYSNEVKATTRLLEDIPKQIWVLLNKLDITPANFCSNETYQKYLKLSNMIITDFPGSKEAYGQDYGESYDSTQVTSAASNISRDVFE